MLVGCAVSSTEQQETEDGRKVQRFVIQVISTINGERKSQVFEVVAYDNAIDCIERSVENSKLVAIDGYLRNNEWNDENGKYHCEIEIVVDDVFQIKASKKED